MTSSMKNLEKKFSENLLTISGTQSSSNSVRAYSDPIPIDLLINIFSRVPAKSIARFRCVSKFWASIFGRPYFTELFLTMSSTHPRILFTLKVCGDLYYLSSPQNPDENSSLVITPDKYFPQYLQIQNCRMLSGLVFLQRGKKNSWMTCNPITGESMLVETKGRSYFGYDPINKQFKVLCILYQTPISYRVLTLGTASNHLWRTVEWKLLFTPLNISGDVCIDGVLYFGASFEGSSRIVSFDVSSEKFDFVNINQDMCDGRSTLFKFNGKLGAHDYYWGFKDVVIWVRDDARNNKWSKSICVLRSLRNGTDNMMYGCKVVGTTSTGEIVFSPYHLRNPFYLLYYNIERKIFTRVNIQGFEEFMDRITTKYSCDNLKIGTIQVETFLDYVERI